MGTDLVAQQNIESVMAGLPKEQRDYLLMRAMGCSVPDSRKLAVVTKNQVRSWRGNEWFCQKEAIVEASEGSWVRDSLSIYLDDQLPFVVSQLLSIILSGENGERPHKDKEKAIEFYLKELCGVSKAVRTSTNFEHFVIEMRKTEEGSNAIQG